MTADDSHTKNMGLEPFATEINFIEKQTEKLEICWDFLFGKSLGIYWGWGWRFMCWGPGPNWQVWTWLRSNCWTSTTWAALSCQFRKADLASYGIADSKSIVGTVNVNWLGQRMVKKPNPILKWRFPESYFPQNRWRIFPKSVADFLKVDDRFSQSWWLGCFSQNW